MKKLLFLGCILLLIGGCVASQKIVIPDEPKLHEVMVMQTDNGICVDIPNTIMLGEDFRALKKYGDDLRKIIEKQNEGK